MTWFHDLMALQPTAVTDAGNGVYSATLTSTTTMGTAKTGGTLNGQPITTRPALVPFQAPKPTVTAVSPASGTTSGGTQITITDTDFTPTSTVAICQGGGANTNPILASDVHCVSPTELAATARSGARAGTFIVFATTANGTDGAAARDRFRYTNPSN